MGYNEFINDILIKRGRHGCGSSYYERHHIIPKSIGGTNTDDNLIDLFPHEHFIAHKLLALENPHNKQIQYAWWNMAHCHGNNGQIRYICTPEEYEEARQNHVKNMIGKNNPNYGGGNLSEEGKKNIGLAQRNRVRSQEEIDKRNMACLRGVNHPNYGGQFVTEEFRHKQSISHLGKHHTEDSKLKMSNKRKRGENANAKKVYCDGIIFECARDCADFLNVQYEHFTRWCRTNKFPDQFKKFNIHYLSK